jgi:hypothetical protein
MVLHFVEYFWMDRIGGKFNNGILREAKEGINAGI